MIDLDKAREFVLLHARLLDRRRLAHLLADGPSDGVVSAVAAYANPDGGFGNAIEPDVRAGASQPLGVLTAFDILHEAGVREHELITRGLDWLQSITADDGGIPFSPASVDEAPHAPWMAPTEGSSLHMTAAVAAAALRLDADHPWVARASAFCRERIAALTDSSAYELKFALDFADAAKDAEVLDRVAPLIPPDGRLRVRGGTEGEELRLLDISPGPDRMSRRLFADDAIAADLDRVEAGQHDDGGWDIDFLKWNPSAAWEWRGRITVDQLALLRANGRV